MTGSTIDPGSASAANLKFLQWVPEIRTGTSNSKAALEIIELLVLL
jgi:hypothetical protein